MSDTLWSAFVETVHRDPSRVAIIQGDDQVSFEQWMRRSLDYVSWLGDFGLRRHDRVVIMMPNSAEMAAAMFGVWGAGGIPVLLNHDAPPSHVEHAIDTVEPRAVITVFDIPSELVRQPEDIPRVDRPSNPAIDIKPADAASIVFTSGSTGRPRGVVQSHGNLVRGCRAVGNVLGIDHHDRIICPVPWSFDYGYGQLLSTALLGSTHILPTTISSSGICDAIAHHRPTVLPGMPSLFAFLLQGLSPFRATDLSSLRLVTNTGGSIAPAVLSDLRHVLDHCRIALNYGLTESYRTSCLDPSLLADHPDSIGTSIPGVQVAVVREDLTRCTPGEEGEIVHRGDYVFLGYFNDPKATAAIRRPDPFASPDDDNTPPVLFTGDYGHLDENGLLYFHGRRDCLLKSMGVCVSPEEVEQLLLSSGLIREVAVFGQKHDLLGDEVWAAVVPALGVTNVRAELFAFFRKALSPYMTPRHLLINEALPRTTTGKTCYESLKREASGQPSATLTRTGNKSGITIGARGDGN